MTRGLGWRKDRAGADKPGHHLLAKHKATAALPPLASPSLLKFRGSRIDQGQAGACVGFALTRGLQLYYAAAGLTAPLASPRQLYYDGRREEWAGQDPTAVPPLTDSGTEPRLMMQATKGLGYVSWGECPYPTDPNVLNDESEMGRIVNTQPAPELYEHAVDQADFDYARVVLMGQQRVQQVADALQNRMPVIFGMQVDSAFMDNHGGLISNINPMAIGGGHMLAVLEVHANGDVLFDNWWGDGDQWGSAEGLGLMSGGLFGSTWIDDVYIIRAAPLLETT